MSKKDKVVNSDSELTEELEKLKKENEALKAKVQSPSEKPSGKTVAMIWPHKKGREGETTTIFGLPAVCGKDGFFIVECPVERIKNEGKRSPKKLISLELFEKKKALEKEFEEQHKE